MSDPMLVPPMPRPADPSANKPIYILRAEDPGVKGKVQYYRVHKIDRNANHVTITGLTVTKAQAEKNILEITANTREINIEIPWQKVISIENVSFKRKKAQGE